MELHARSSFSFLQASTSPETLVQHAAELGHQTIGIADHMGFYGSARAHQAANQAGIRAIVGATLDFNNQTNLPILVRNRTGYQNLCKFLTKIHLRSRNTDTLATHFDLASLHPGELEGLVCLTGDQHGQIPKLLLKNKKIPALHHLELLKNTFGPHNVHIELNPAHTRTQNILNHLLTDLAEHTKTPLIVSNAPLHASPKDRILADALTCLNHKTTLDRAGTLLAPNHLRHLLSPHQLAEHFKTTHPQAVRNTHHLADSLHFTLTDLGYTFPNYTDSETGKTLTDTEQNQRLRQLAFAGAKARCKKLTPQLTAQIEKELALIAKLNFPGYFLIVWSIKEFARKNNILCQGRGSAANSVTCYALGITNVDPLTQNLVFERFLSENRTSWPDIDIDFPSGDQREKVIQHIYQKHAPNGAAMTANVITYRPKSAFREMSKILGFPEEIANRFSELGTSPRAEEPSLELTAENGSSPMSTLYPDTEIQNLKQTIHNAGIPAEHPRLPALLHLYTSILRLPRHLGQHSGGMVISSTELDNIVPLQPATMPGRTILQWDKDDCEDLGIIKVDILGLGMLAAIEDTIEIATNRGKPFNLAEIPLDDPATFELLQNADTIGTFQVESRAQMATLPIMKPKTFYDVAIEVAIIRPGPIVGDLLHPYLNRRNGLEPVDYIHPSFEPILKRTLGVPLFQEQILEMAMTIADFNGSQADQLRRAMGYKRDDTRMHQIMAELYTAMDKKGVDTEVQKKIVASIQSFALYGFPESHAISFGLLAYASCWIKAHHPAALYASLLNRQPMGFYSPSTLLQDAKRHGIKIKPVSIAHSQILTIVTAEKEIRLGLSRIKGLSNKLLENIIQQRNNHPFTHLTDLLTRTSPNKKERRLLAKSGALNTLPDIQHRRHAQWQTEQPLLPGLFTPDNQSTDISKHPAQRASESYPRPVTSYTQSPPSIPLPPMTPFERLNADLSTQSHTSGPHPMKLLRKSLPSLKNTHRAIDLKNGQHRQPIKIGGLVICRQRPGTAKGHCFISLEDETGIANIFVPKTTFQLYRLTITTEPFLLIHGDIQIGEANTISIYTHHIEPLKTTTTLPKNISHDFH